MLDLNTDKYFCGPKIDEVCDSRHNNFRIIRHLAASFVIFSHAFVLNKGVDGILREPFHILFGLSLAEITVDVYS